MEYGLVYKPSTTSTVVFLFPNQRKYRRRTPFRSNSQPNLQFLPTTWCRGPDDAARAPPWAPPSSISGLASVSDPSLSVRNLPFLTEASLPLFFFGLEYSNQFWTLIVWWIADYEIDLWKSNSIEFRLSFFFMGELVSIVEFEVEMKSNGFISCRLAAYLLVFIEFVFWFSAALKWIWKVIKLRVILQNSII